MCAQCRMSRELSEAEIRFIAVKYVCVKVKDSCNKRWMSGLHCFGIRHKWDGRVVSCTSRPHVTPKEIPWHPFPLEAEWIPGLLNADKKKRIGKLQNFQTPYRESNPEPPHLAAQCLNPHDSLWRFFFLIFLVPCIMLFNGEISPTRCNNCVFHSHWLYSTCFGWQSHPSSGVQCCIWPQVSWLT